ncbi:Methionine import ATP-binding protein metN [Mycobacteroides abscessus]|nr:Methionine import ATP-binding protein metN [Mycobacteroides abscessus]
MGDVAPLIQFQNVTKTFQVGKKTVTAVDDVSLDIGSGDVFAMIGYSGAGKTRWCASSTAWSVPPRAVSLWMARK